MEETPRDEDTPTETGATPDPLDGLEANPAPPTTKTEIVRAWILAHPDASINDTIRDCPAHPSRGLVSIVRKQIGVDAPATPPRPRTPTRAPGATASPAGAAAPSSPAEEAVITSIFERVMKGEGRILTPTQQAALLSEFALSPLLHPQTRVAMLNSLRAAGAQTSANRVGPGPPLTDEDKLVRLTRLFSACGRDLVRRAFKSAFSPRATETLDAPQGTAEADPAPAAG